MGDDVYVSMMRVARRFLIMITVDDLHTNTHALSEGVVGMNLIFINRADGQLDKITYPKVDGERRKIQYDYNKRGKIMRIPSIVTNIEYDLGNRCTSQRYVNGTEQKFSYDNTSGCLVGIELVGPQAQYVPLNILWILLVTCSV